MHNALMFSSLLFLDNSIIIIVTIAGRLYQSYHQDQVCSLILILLKYFLCKSSCVFLETSFLLLFHSGQEGSPQTHHHHTILQAQQQKYFRRIVNIACDWLQFVRSCSLEKKNCKFMCTRGKKAIVLPYHDVSAFLERYTQLVSSYEYPGVALPETMGPVRHAPFLKSFTCFYQRVAIPTWY